MNIHCSTALILINISPHGNMYCVCRMPLRSEPWYFSGLGKAVSCCSLFLGTSHHYIPSGLIHQVTWGVTLHDLRWQKINPLCLWAPCTGCLKGRPMIVYFPENLHSWRHNEKFFHQLCWKANKNSYATSKLCFEFLCFFFCMPQVELFLRTQSLVFVWLLLLFLHSISFCSVLEHNHNFPSFHLV